MNAEVLQRTAHELVVAERQRQTQKWGVQKHEDESWLMILSEEVGEVGKAICHYNEGKGPFSDIIEEATHVTAVVVQILEDHTNRKSAEVLEFIDATYGPTPTGNCQHLYFKLLEFQGHLTADLIRGQHWENSKLLERFAWYALALLENLLCHQS